MKQTIKKKKLYEMMVCKTLDIRQQRVVMLERWESNR